MYTHTLYYHERPGFVVNLDSFLNALVDDDTLISTWYWTLGRLDFKAACRKASI